MKIMMIALISWIGVLALAGCGHRGTIAVGTIDVARITANWPKFLNYDRQLQSDMQAIEASSASDATKRQEQSTLQQRYLQMQSDVTEDVRSATEQVAKRRNITMVFTREYVGYGGVDITPDVEKILNITENGTPQP